MKGTIPVDGPVLPGCWNRTRQAPCECTRKTTLLFDVDLDLETVYTHKSCVCNEKMALTARHQKDDGYRFDPKLAQALENVWMRDCPSCVPITISEVVQKYTGRKRALAETAALSLKERAVEKRDSRLRMFLKDDKYTNTEPKAPRCIQYRDKRYALTLARYTYPIEDALYLQEDRGVLSYSKKLDGLALGTNLRLAWDSFIQPVALLLDHSAFDAHWNEYLQHCAVKFNSRCFVRCGKSEEVKRLLSWQSHNVGSTKNGTRYATTYTRMSGDQNTGLDNSKGNLSMIRLALELHGIDGIIVVNGDDSVVVMDQSEIPKTHGLIDTFARMGQKTKLEWAYEFEHVEFCQTRPVWTQKGWRMCRNPIRVLTRMRYTVKHMTKRIHLPYIKAICQAESAVNQDLPVMGPLSAAWASSLNVRRYRGALDQDWLLKIYKKDRLTTYQSTVDYESRISFESAWGISIPEQIAMESLTMNFGTEIDQSFALRLGLCPLNNG